MDIISFQEAKKTRRSIGKLSELTTTDKSSAVAAINEVNNKVSTIPSNLTNITEVLVEYDLVNVQPNEVREQYIPFMRAGFIKGIKCSGTSGAGDFYLKIFTKNPDFQGHYVYYSGLVTNLLWDVMDIPCIDESGMQQVYVMLDNRGALSSFKLQLFTTQGYNSFIYTNSDIEPILDIDGGTC